LQNDNTLDILQMKVTNSRFTANLNNVLIQNWGF